MVAPLVRVGYDRPMATCGTRYSYRIRGCRCEACCEWQRRASREYRARKRAEAEQQ